MYGIPITPLGHLAHAVFPLLVIAVLLRRFTRLGSPSEPWRASVDLSLGLGAALAGTVLSSAWMTRYFLFRFSLTASDFGQYCESLGAFRSGELALWAKQRSLVAGTLPGLLADSLGVVDALFVGALLSHVVMGLGIYLWARAAHSRLAGLTAVMVAAAVAPLVHLSRTVTFYPETVAGCVMSAAAATLALRLRTLPAVLFSALVAGLVLLLDVRGLLWALPAVGLTAFAAVLLPGWWRRGVGILMIAGCLMGSFKLGEQTSWELTPSLEQQTSFYVDEAMRRFQPNNPNAGISTQEEAADSRYVWGRTSLAEIPDTLQFLWTLKQGMPAGIEDQPETAYGRRTHVTPWLLPAGLSLLLALWGVRRRPWLALGFLGSLVPFAVALQGTAMMVGHSRYMANGITMVPVLLGLGFAVAAKGSLDPVDEASDGPTLTKAEWGGLGLVLILVLGMVPTWLSPVANWRAPVSADIEPSNSLWHAAHSSALPVDVAPACVDALREDFEVGLPVGSKLLGWTVEESPTHDPTLEGE
jgi:hypothetical protein